MAITIKLEGGILHGFAKDTFTVTDKVTFNNLRALFRDSDLIECFTYKDSSGGVVTFASNSEWIAIQNIMREQFLDRPGPCVICAQMKSGTDRLEGSDDHPVKIEHVNKSKEGPIESMSSDTKKTSYHPNFSNVVNEAGNVHPHRHSYSRTYDPFGSDEEEGNDAAAADAARTDVDDIYRDLRELIATKPEFVPALHGFLKGALQNPKQLDRSRIHSALEFQDARNWRDIQCDLGPGTCRRQFRDRYGMDVNQGPHSYRGMTMLDDFRSRAPPLPLASPRRFHEPHYMSPDGMYSHAFHPAMKQQFPGCMDHYNDDSRGFPVRAHETERRFDPDSGSYRLKPSVPSSHPVSKYDRIPHMTDMSDSFYEMENDKSRNVTFEQFPPSHIHQSVGTVDPYNTIGIEAHTRDLLNKERNRDKDRDDLISGLGQIASHPRLHRTMENLAVRPSSTL